MSEHYKLQPLVSSSRRHLTTAAIAAAIGVLVGPTLIFVTGGYRVNVTPSFLLGLWQITPLNGSVQVGETVFICLPINRPVFRLAWQRGYLTRGLCRGGIAPLIKTVAAVSGQIIAIENHEVFVDGHVLAHSSILSRDGRNRVMMPFAGGVIPRGSVFLHSDYSLSYDSRYFGPVPAKGIIGRATLVFAF